MPARIVAALDQVKPWRGCWLTFSLWPGTPLLYLNYVIRCNIVMAARSIPSLARRERERAATRQKILNAARRMLVGQGEERATMRAIAAKIGYTPTAIYHYFKDKDALVAELSALDYRAFSQALQRTGTAGD